MTTNFSYSFVSSYEEDNVLTAGFADSQFNSKEYLLFQRFLDPEDDDGIYTEHNGQERGAYGGIERLVLSRDQAVILLTQETAQILNTEREIKISFSATDKQFQQLKMDLYRVFDGDFALEIR